MLYNKVSNNNIIEAKAPNLHFLYRRQNQPLFLDKQFSLTDHPTAESFGCWDKHFQGQKLFLLQIYKRDLI